MLPAGSKLGPYEIVSPLGAGGMGEVYRARDTKLNRDVALKVLPEILARDPDRMARFKREAQVLAALNHPNIAAIYGFEEALPVAAIYDRRSPDGERSSPLQRALVMELVEGQTLAERIGAATPSPATSHSREGGNPLDPRRRGGDSEQIGAMPTDDVLAISKQIADALEYAHERGIIHRDLKPANVKVTPEGTVKVLDFGLAKALETPLTSGPSPHGRGWPGGPGEGSGGIDNSPTLTAAATQAGVIIGTAAYMSPEQARGKIVDRRADIWAFGCVMYEMLSGKRPFEGETVTDVLASVVVKEPDWESLPPGTPPRIREVIRRCLIKDPKQRLRDIGEARIAIEETISGDVARPSRPWGTGETPVQQPTGETPVLRRALPWALAAIIAIGLALDLTTGLFRKPPAPPQEIRFNIAPPEGTFPTEIAVSPDGKSLAFGAAQVINAGTRSLWVRSLGAETSRHLADVSGTVAIMPFWSPDSRTVGFFADGQLKTVSVDGGPVQTICGAAFGAGGTWNQNGDILFGQNPGPVMRVQATGGTPTLATPTEANYSHVGPTFLPDGIHFIYTKANEPGFSALYVGSLDSNQPKLLLNNLGGASFAPPDHLLFARNGVLMAQRLDTKRWETIADPVSIPDVQAALGFDAVSASSDVLAYHAPFNGGIQWFFTAQLTWYNRAGKELGTVGPVGNYLEAKLSPDGKLVVADAGLDLKDPWGSANLFLLDLSNGVYSRMTLGEGSKVDPIWSPDSRSIVYEGGRGFLELGVGQSQPSEVIANGVLRFTDDWSKDGNYIISRSLDQRSAYALPMTGERKPILMVQDAFVRDQFHFSPDDRWVAYNSNESGRMEVYIASFPKMDHKHQVSTGGGGEPLWRGDGKELYYLTPDGKMMSVNVTEGEDVETSAPKMLFQTSLKVNNIADQYQVTADGKKFLLVDPVKTQAASAQQSEPIHVIVNWDAALAK